MKSKILPVIAHMKHVSFSWYSNHMIELSKCALKRGYIVDTIYSVDELSRFEGESHVIVMGASGEWLDEVFEHLEAMGIQGIAEHGTSPLNSLYEVQTDQTSIIKQSVQLFHDNNRTNIAFFGAKKDDVSDKIKVDAFRAECVDYDEEDIYYTDNSIEACFNTFVKKADKYNAVICADDITGVYFIGACQKVGIKIPDDIYVTGNGSVRLRSFCRPTLTTFANQMHYENTQPEVLIKVYDILTKYPQISYLKLGGRALMLEGGSTGGTGNQAVKKRRVVEFDEDQNVLLEDIIDPDKKVLCAIDRALRACDEVDIGILAKLIAGENYAKTAMSLYISVDTVKYRLKRIYKRFGVSGKGELIDVVSKYGICF